MHEGQKVATGETDETSEARDVKLWLMQQTWPDARQLALNGRPVIYRHPYGFIVSRLSVSYFENWQIRLHLWPGNSTLTRLMRENGTARQLVHCHGWPLLSRVLLGELHESTYKLIQGKRGSHSLYAVESDYSTGVSRLSFSRGQIEPRRVSTSIRSAASGCAPIPAGQFHSSVSGTDACASLVATGLHHTSPSFVVAPSVLTRKENPRGEVGKLEDELAEYDNLYERQKGTQDRWAAFVFLIDPQGDVLMVRSRRRADLWQPVGGRGEAVDRNPEATVIRELREETGLTLSAKELSHLSSAPRDVGSGDVHFWVARLGSRPEIRFPTSELNEAVWMHPENLESLNLYGATEGVLQDLRNAMVK